MIPIYRIWDKRTGKWMNVQEAIISNGEVYEPWRDFEDGLSLTEDDYVFVHSTGLKDKNGVEIFEGDCFIKIFRTIEIPTGKNGIEKSVGIVKFHEGAFQVHIDGWGYELLSEVAQPHIYGANDDYWENVVIGNIYENPELLEVEG